MTNQVNEEGAPVMTVTPQQIAKLTPRHRVLMKDPAAPAEVEPVEMGLWEDMEGELITVSGTAIRYSDGSLSLSAMDCIVGIIEPPHEWQYGDVIGRPGNAEARAVYLPCSQGDGFSWFTAHGWAGQGWADERLAEGWAIDPDGKQATDV